MSPERPKPSRSLGEGFDSWLVRTYVWGPSRTTARPAGPVPDEPTSDGRVSPIAQATLLALGLLVPALVAALLIPLRDTITAPTQTLVLVLPVVAVAVLADRVAAALAAVTAALAYDVFLTEPYYSLTIDAAEDAEAAVVLGLIGIVVGTLVARELEARMRSASRADELAALRSVSHALASGAPDRLVHVATDRIRALLDLRSCEWSAGFHGTVSHVMSTDGSLSNRHGASLPDGIVEVPVVHRSTELGRLPLRSRSSAVVSAEERATVLAVADMLAAGLVADPSRR